MVAAEGVHRSIQLSKETEATLYSQDVVKAGEDVCQQCYDAGCNASQVPPPLALHQAAHLMTI